MKKINEWFECLNCWKIITPAKKTCRNHCPFCFVSVHLDLDLPWDRNSFCGWIMYPIEYFLWNWKIKIVFKCQKCWKKHINKSNEDDLIQDLDSYIKEYLNKY